MRGAKVVCVMAIALAMACEKDNTATTTTTATSGSASALVMPSASAAASADPAIAAQNAADEEQAADELRTHHRHHHHGGVAMFIHMAIDTLGVDAAKKAQLDKIQSDLFTAMAPARDAHKALISTLADGVAAGKIDTAKVDAAVAKVQTASAGVHAATIDALNALHAALLPVERQALMDKVQAHADVWKKVNTEEAQDSKEKGSHLAKLTQTLSLTADQVDKIDRAQDQRAAEARLIGHRRAPQGARDGLRRRYLRRQDAHHGERGQRRDREARHRAHGPLLRDGHAAAHARPAHQARRSPPSTPERQAPEFIHQVRP